MLLLIATDTVDRMSDLPSLSSYLRRLHKRCEGEPRAGALEVASLDISSMTAIGSWSPAPGTSSAGTDCWPPAPSATVGSA